MHRPSDGQVDVGTGFCHLVVQVDDLGATIGSPSNAGLMPGPMESPGGPDGPRTPWLRDPDGYRIELVQWPPVTQTESRLLTLARVHGTWLACARRPRGRVRPTPQLTSLTRIPRTLGS